MPPPSWIIGFDFCKDCWFIIKEIPSPVLKNLFILILSYAAFFCAFKIPPLKKPSGASSKYNIELFGSWFTPGNIWGIKGEGLSCLESGLV